MGDAKCKTDGNELRVLDLFLSDMQELDSDSLRKKADTERERVKGGTKREFQASKRKRKNPSWLKRKQELYTLRQQTEELGTHVAYLQLQQEDRRTQLGISAERYDQLSKWEFAERKRQQAAQAENKALKAQVRKYSHFLAKLRTEVATAAGEQDRHPDLVVSSSVTEELQTSKFRLFTMLQARLDERTNNAHTILREIHGNFTCQREPYSVQMHDGCMEYSWSHVLPFDVLATFNAAWGIVESGGSRRNMVSRVLGRSQDVYTVASRHVLASVRNGAATVNTYGVIKRYIVPGNFVILAESRSEHHGASGEWSNTTQESVWCAVRRIQSRSTDGQASVFQLKAVVRSESIQKYSSLDYAGDTIRELIEIQRQYLENALLDSVRGN